MRLIRVWRKLYLLIRISANAWKSKKRKLGGWKIEIQDFALKSERFFGFLWQTLILFPPKRSEEIPVAMFTAVTFQRIQQNQNKRFA